jgi:hypothetical protein
VSIVTRIKRLSETFVPSSALESVPSPSTPPMHSQRHPSVAEAPERAASEHEGPESYRGRSAESCDAGGGRASHLEHEFTHGRSQS